MGSEMCIRDRVGEGRAMEMILTGEIVNSSTAERIGLINRVLDDNNVTQQTEELASLIASKSSMVLETGKKAFYNQKDMSLSEAYEYASKVMVENMLKNDAREGINAFIEKRHPKWQDK